MKKVLNYLNTNKENIIRLVYLLPILFSVIVSINHVITWYQLANPNVWAVYLSIGVEVAALVTVVAIIFGKPGWHIYILFIVVTLIQFIGNIFYSYQFIDENAILFTQWNEFINIITGYEESIKSNRLWLAILSGASAPLMSLLSLHLLSKFEMKKSIKLMPQEIIETPQEIIKIPKKIKSSSKKTKHTSKKTKLSDIYNEKELIEKNLEENKNIDDELPIIVDNKDEIIESLDSVELKKLMGEVVRNNQPHQIKINPQK